MSSIFARLGCDGLCGFNEGKGDWKGSALGNFSPLRGLMGGETHVDLI